MKFRNRFGVETTVISQPGAVGNVRKHYLSWIRRR